MLMSQEKSICWLHIFSIVGIGLILTIPIVINGCLLAHDLQHHLIYAKSFSEQFWKGDFYPRWLQNLNAGLGSPTFFFYAPIPYYFTSLFYSLFTHNQSSCNELGLSSSLALIASGLTAYFWLKEITPKNSALIASILYMAWPYHLAVDLYRRFAFAEYWSFVWLPLILYFSRKIVRGSRINIIGLALGFSLLALTHLPSFIIFFPVPIGYALLLANRNQWKIVISRLVLAVIIMVGLSAIYWLPAMTTQESISMDAILTREFDYENNFLFTGPKFAHKRIVWQYLEILTVLTGGLAFSAWKISGQGLEVTSRRESNYWMVIAMIALFMTLPLSKFVWDALPAVQRIQFPWRFNTVLTVAIVGLLALAISRLKISSNSFNKKKLFLSIVCLTAIIFILTIIQMLPLQKSIVFLGSRNTVLAISLIAFFLLGISYIQTPINFSKHKFLVVELVLMISLFLASVFHYRDHIFVDRLDDSSVSKILEVSKAANEHRPRWVPKDIFNEKDLSRLGENFSKIHIDAGQADFLIEKWQPRNIVLQVNAITATRLTVGQFYYPGWTARLKERSQILPVHFSKLGLLQISVPAGKHQVSVTLDAGVEERVGQIISAISATIALFLSVAFFLPFEFSCLRNR